MKTSTTLTAAALVLLATAWSTSSSYLGYNPTECGAVHITVSSLQNNPKKKGPDDDKLELNWDLSTCDGVPEENIPDTVALFDSDPEAAPSVPLAWTNVTERTWNHAVTRTSLGTVDLGDWKKTKKTSLAPVPGARCLPFWIASFKHEKLIKSNCLKIQPTWMEDIKEHIGDIPLSKLLLPGSHNAGSFLSPVPSIGIVDRFLLCQDRDVWTQLVSGIRFLDFRIAYYETFQTIFNGREDFADRLWLNHNMIKVTPLLPLLKDIRRFLDSTTDEIVVLDVHQLPVGFYQTDALILERHQILIKLLEKEFAGHILAFSEVQKINTPKRLAGPTVSEVLKTGKRLIIGYPDRTLTNKYRWLWPATSHKWGNTNNPDKLMNYLHDVMKNPQTSGLPYNNPLWSAMAQMTPTATDIIFDYRGGLRKMADAINRRVSHSVSRDWWPRANVVSSDFYMGSNIIDLSVYFNTLKG